MSSSDSPYVFVANVNNVNGDALIQTFLSKRDVTFSGLLCLSFGNGLVEALTGSGATFVRAIRGSSGRDLRRCCYEGLLTFRGVVGNAQSILMVSGCSNRVDGSLTSIVSIK